MEGLIMMRMRSKVYRKAFDFGIKLIKTIKQFKVHPNYFEIINQTICSSMAISANIIEAQSARTIVEFSSGHAIALRESRETLHWINAIEYLGINQNCKLDYFKEENLEIIKILSKIIITVVRRKINKFYLSSLPSGLCPLSSAL